MSEMTHIAAIREATKRILYAVPGLEGILVDVVGRDAERILRLLDAIENLMESCRACDMCALNESDDTCSDNGEGYCSPVWIGRKEG